MSNFMSQYITHCPFTPSSGSNPALSWGNKKHLKIFSRLISRPNGLQFTLTWQTQQTNRFATNENVYTKTFRNEQYIKSSQTELKAMPWFHREFRTKMEKNLGCTCPTQNRWLQDPDYRNLLRSLCGGENCSLEGLRGWRKIRENSSKIDRRLYHVTLIFRQKLCIEACTETLR